MARWVMGERALGEREGEDGLVLLAKGGCPANKPKGVDRPWGQADPAKDDECEAERRTEPTEPSSGTRLTCVIYRRSKRGEIEVGEIAEISPVNCRLTVGKVCRRMFAQSSPM